MELEPTGGTPRRRIAGNPLIWIVTGFVVAVILKLLGVEINAVSGLVLSAAVMAVFSIIGAVQNRRPTDPPDKS